MRREKGIDFQFAAQGFIGHFKPYVHEHHRTVRIGQHMFDDTIAAGRIGIGEPVEQAVAFRIIHFVTQVALLLMAEAFSVGDEQLDITRVGLVDGRIVNFVEDSVTEREPNMAARVISCADALLRAVRPAWLDPRRAKGAIAGCNHALSVEP